MHTSHAGFNRFYDGVGKLITVGTVDPVWSPDGESLVFIDGPPENRCGWLVDLGTGEKEPLFADIELIREAVREATAQTPPGRGLPFERIAFTGPRTLLVELGTARLVIDLDTMTVTRRPDHTITEQLFDLSDDARQTPRVFMRSMPLIDPWKAFESLSPDNARLASTVNGNVIARLTVDGRTVPLTTDGTPEHEYRFELAEPTLASSGLSMCNWSPDGSRLAVSKVDNRGVHQSPQVHYLKREDEVIYRYVAQAGGVLERTTLHVLDVYGRPAVELDLGDTSDSYPVHAAWFPGSTQLLLFVLSRDCRRAEVLLGDAQTGKTRKVFSEEGASFIRIHHDIYYFRKLGLFLTPDGAHILWLSERSGWKHLYMYDLEGNLVRQLTDGAWPVDYVHHIDDAHVYFTGHLDQNRPYDVHLARVPLEGGPVEQLSEGPGTHSMIVAPSGDALVDTWSTPDSPPRSVLRRMDGSRLCVLADSDLSQLKWTPPQEFVVTAADEITELWGVMFFPADFDESRQYPLIDYVYGGPQTVVAPHSFSPGGYAAHAHALAQLGYVVMMMDARGTPGRSKAFHDVIYGDWAAGLPDHVAAIDQLKNRYSFLATAKVGVIGHSWGGNTAFRLAAERPDVYSAAVASAPGFDPFSTVLYECYLGLPQDNLNAYREADSLPLAKHMKTPFMLAGGNADHATWTDAMKMSEMLIRAGADHEFVVLPEQYHAYDGVHDAYYWNKVSTFFQTHLQEKWCPA